MITMGKKRTTPEEIPRYEDNDDVVVDINGISYSEGNTMEEDGIRKLSVGRKDDFIAAQDGVFIDWNNKTETNIGKREMKPATKILYVLIFGVFAVMDLILLLYYFIPPFFSIP